MTTRTPLQTKQVRVTSGAGFLGSHRCDRRIEPGRDVRCVANFFTGSKANFRKPLGL